MDQNVGRVEKKSSSLEKNGDILGALFFPTDNKRINWVAGLCYVVKAKDQLKVWI